MSWINDLGNVISSAINIVKETIPTLGPLAEKAGKMLQIAGKYLTPIVQVIQAIGLLLGILKPKDDIEEMGAKAMNADKKPSDFDSNAEYINYLREEVQLDKEKFEKANDIEKAARKAVGASIVASAISEKKGFDIPLETWVAIAKLDLTDKAKEVDTLLETFKDEKLEDFAKYVDGKLDIQKESKIGDDLVEMYKKLEPNASIDEIEEKVMKMDVSGK